MSSLPPAYRLSDVDVAAAVAAGIITPDQAKSLSVIAQRREQHAAVDLSYEERFLFIRGFHDVFLAIGVVLFLLGAAYFSNGTLVGCLVCALMVWAISEVLVHKLKLVLPGIVLACAFCLFVLCAAHDFLFADPTSPFRSGNASRLAVIIRELTPISDNLARLAVAMLCTAGAVALFYVRFRLPFALLLFGASMVAMFIASVLDFWPDTPPSVANLLVLGCGFAVFAAAMAFDLSDAHRLTRRADCAFWLHLLAAPIMVHSVFRLTFGNFQAIKTMTAGGAGIIVLLFASLTLMALAIDRKALLVSGLGYLGTAVGFAISSNIAKKPQDPDMPFYLSIVILGVLVLVLGIAWVPLRRIVMTYVFPGLSKHLPPAMVPT